MMIVTSDNVENIDSKANLGQTSASDIHPPPPPYTSTTAAESSSRSPPEHHSSQDLTYPYDVPPLLTQRPCNWLYAYNANSRIKDRYILDPSLKVPSSLMSEAAAEVQEAERDTLNLRSDTGSVDVVARIVDSSSGGANGAKKRRVRITLHSTHGSVTGKILSVSGSPTSKFHLTATSHTGGVYIHIPRSFHGLISASTTHGSIQFSDELTKNTTTFADGQKKKCFVGDFAGYPDDDGDDDSERKEEWDELSLESQYGAVRVYYADEWEAKQREKAVKEREREERRKMNEGKSFFSRIFGIS
ncbi:hypothetical protein CCMSSC00406_0007556 [Pleurotus cornucopiae]|uniref:Uncharacterized protein n=1 Tax=Pleurotus cornucopiae TaxID=5321 RepID=A0ACB7J7B7_PLECO|nr:hypothetical protein CCMSSC00406_0007556 [Pleurotus cornucopiae]